MKYKIDHNEIYLIFEKDWIRVKTDSGDNLPLHNQTKEETTEIIHKNYKIVKDYYQNKVQNKISSLDLERVSLKIVLFYFHMYNLWRQMYKREKNRDLTFISKDFEHPYTSSQIIDYFKSTYPDNYAPKCEIMLDMTPEKFQEFAKNKEQFDNM